MREIRKWAPKHPTKVPGVGTVSVDSPALVTVDVVLPSGKVEIRTQAGGIYAVDPAEVI